MAAIKICGITRLADALFAARSGADALGFIFHPRSPRYIAPEAAKRIVDALPHSVTKERDRSILTTGDRITTVGVFVNLPVGEVAQIASLCNLDLIQLHGSESAEYCSAFPPERVIKNFALRTAADLAQIHNYKVRAVLVDAYDPLRHGGTGRTSNWELAAAAKEAMPVILSGGLNIRNIREALATVKPDAVDINSGI
ncbi:MAG: phosphoribosylanthranilate isomerase, partial [Syntrophales bacterium]|nr:phosphoribosylanthranilate isomerase [Syntrophales bacterium]